jgi:hypothetical protein
MTSNIKSISLWRDNPRSVNNVPLVKIDFNFPCTWTVLNISDLKEIISNWIVGEELVYPPSKGFRGRWMLFDELKELFDKKKNKGV